MTTAEAVPLDVLFLGVPALYALQAALPGRATICQMLRQLAVRAILVVVIGFAFAVTTAYVAAAYNTGALPGWAAVAGLAGWHWRHRGERDCGADQKGS